jgi:hypothetical protein
MTCCALGEQDAILGHVASRGDRFPRVANKNPPAVYVNPARRRRLAPITHNPALAMEKDRGLGARRGAANLFQTKRA